MRHPVSAASVALAAVLIVGGCAGSDPADDGQAATSGAPSSDAPATGIDLDGSQSSPITWQLPAGATASDPVGVAQRYIAVIQQVGAPDATLDPSVVDGIATRAPAASARNAIAAGPSQPDVSSGPVWVWLDAAQENGDRAVVKACADVGYFQPAGSKTPATFRAETWTTELERVEAADGKTRWKVSRFGTGPASDADPFESQCPEWAKHTP